MRQFAVVCSCLRLLRLGCWAGAGRVRLAFSICHPWRIPVGAPSSASKHANPAGHHARATVYLTPAACYPPASPRPAESGQLISVQPCLLPQIMLEAGIDLAWCSHRPIFSRSTWGENDFNSCAQHAQQSSRSCGCLRQLHAVAVALCYCNVIDA